MTRTQRKGKNKTDHRLQNLFKSPFTPDIASHRDIQTEERFAQTIEHECELVDRNGHEFSLLTFQLQRKLANSNHVKSVLQSVLDRIRVVDEIGWIGLRSFGLTLPYTAKKGALRLASDIYTTLAEKSIGTRCEIYTYPENWPTSGLISTPHERTNQNHQAEPPAPITARQDAHPLSGHLSRLCEKKMPWWKRTIDLIGTSLLLALTAPLFLAIVVLVKLVSRGPVFFKQVRVGHAGQLFTVLKFRTMQVSAQTDAHRKHFHDFIDADTPMRKLDADNDPRVIPFGKMLRLTGLDELPQFLNVLRGEMSLVGPRPCIPYEVEKYLNWQHKRFQAVPGLTGLWQVSGKNRTTFKQMVALDIKYQRELSFKRDAAILMKTVPAITAQIYELLTERAKNDTRS